MSGYLDEPDSDEEPKEIKVLDEATKTEILQNVGNLKAEGNKNFVANSFEEAIKFYSQAIKLLKENNLDRDPILFLNRSASYMGLKRFVPALSDANQAIELDPENWKGYWRKGVSLMSLSKRIFRTKEAIEAFEKCARCSSLPENKRKDVQTELYKARERMAQQEAESPPPDLSKCVPS